MINGLLIIDWAENDDDLDRQWAEWNQQTHANRRRSNNACLSKYGMTNLDRYEFLKGKFNKEPIDPVETGDPEVTGDVQDLGTSDDSIQESSKESKLLYPTYSPSITPEEALAQGGFYDCHGIWNSIMTLPSDPGRLYRGRVECLIIKDGQVYLCKRPTDEYRLPGGSFEVKNNNDTQCYNECKEEARILIKNIKNTGITYTRTYSHPADWAKDLPVQWTGQYIEVYVADYDKFYNGAIDRNDRDEDMYNNGRFYDIDDVYPILRPEHKRAIDKCVRGINIKEDTDETIEVVGRADNINMDQIIPDPLSSASIEMYDAAKEWSNRSNIKMIIERYSLDALEREYTEFMLQTYYHRKVSNQESIRIFGFDNLTHYTYLKARLLKKDETKVKVDDIINSDEESSTIVSEYTSILPINLKKKVDIIKEELSYDYDKITVHNMLDDLWSENANLVNKAVVKKFINETLEFIGSDSYMSSLLPYFTPIEMDELGVFEENAEDNFYNVASTTDKMWYELYSRTGNPGVDWFKMLNEAYGNMIKNPTNENKQAVLELGWNPELSFSLDVIRETSKLTQQKLDKRYNIDIIDITESLNDLDDYQEIPYINKTMAEYNLSSYLNSNIEMVHTSGRLFVDYDGRYVAHISIYNNSIVGINSWYKGPELLSELIDWAIKEKQIDTCYCNKADIALKRILESKGFIAKSGDLRIEYVIQYKVEDINDAHKLSAYTARSILKNMLNDIGYQGYSQYKNCFEIRDVESDDGAYVFAKWNVLSLGGSQLGVFFDILSNIREYISSSLNGFILSGINRAKTYGFLSVVPDSMISEASRGKEKVLPVYIVTCYTSSPMGKAIQKFTNNTYSHAALGFDASLSKLYSFNLHHSNGKHGGLSIESIGQYMNDSREAELNVSIVYLKESDYNKLKDRLDYYIANEKDTSYSVKNIFNIIINRVEDGTEQFSMVCSQFVDSMFKAINVDLTHKSSNLVTPGDLSYIDNPKVYKVYEGKARGYNPKKIDTITHKLVGTIGPIKESAFIKEARMGIYHAIPIFEAKELPIGFDDSGALLIKNYKSIDYDVEYSRANKLLKSYKANKNWKAMEYELCKLWFMNTILLKKIEVAKNKEEKDKLIKIRAKIMNDFTIYLNEVNKNVEGFNFSEYYEQTPFNETVIKISGSTLKYTAHYLKAAIKGVL